MQAQACRIPSLSSPHGTQSGLQSTPHLHPDKNVSQGKQISYNEDKTKDVQALGAFGLFVLSLTVSFSGGRQLDALVLLSVSFLLRWASMEWLYSAFSSLIFVWVFFYCCSVIVSMSTFLFSLVYYFSFLFHFQTVPAAVSLHLAYW